MCSCRPKLSISFKVSTPFLLDENREASFKNMAIDTVCTYPTTQSLLDLQLVERRFIVLCSAYAIFGPIGPAWASLKNHANDNPEMPPPIIAMCGGSCDKIFVPPRCGDVLDYRETFDTATKA